MQTPLSACPRKHIHQNVQQLAPRKGQPERYRDSQVVTRKGERFIKVDVSLDPGPGCEIGGIIGWRTKQGRRGLGQGSNSNRCDTTNRSPQSMN